MAITPAEARQLAKNYVVRHEALSSDAKVRVSDFGELTDGGYSVLVDVTIGPIQTRRTRYRIKMDKNGKVKSFITR